jgi:DNA polymerase-3 subunit delta
MQIAPAKLAASLAAKLPSILLLAGDEPLLVQEALDLVRARAKAAGYSERISFTVEPGFHWQQVQDECQSMSLFASLKVVEVQMPRGPNGHRRSKAESDDSSSSKSAGDDGFKALQALAEKPPRDVLLLVVTGALEKAQRDSKWYSALEAAGLAVYAHPVKPEELPQFITARAQAAGLRLTPDAAAELALRTEGNLLACAQEITKLALLHPAATIDAEDLIAAVADSSRFEAFTLVEKILVGAPEAAVHALERLRQEGISALELIGALGYALRTWAAAGAAYAKSRDLNSAMIAAKVFGPRRAPYEAALKRSKGFSPAAALVRLGGIDKAVKTGQEAYAWEELLTLVLAASGAAKL